VCAPFAGISRPLNFWVPFFLPFLGGGMPPKKKPRLRNPGGLPNFSNFFSRAKPKQAQRVLLFFCFQSCRGGGWGKNTKQKPGGPTRGPGQIPGRAGPPSGGNFWATGGGGTPNKTPPPAPPPTVIDPEGFFVFFPKTGGSILFLLGMVRNFFFFFAKRGQRFV